MDGNGRWASRRRLPRHAGHRAGVRATLALVRECARRGIEYLTLFAFSSENWGRPEIEVSFLIELFLRTLDREIMQLHRNGVQLAFIGSTERFPRVLRGQMRRGEQLTRRNRGLRLSIAVGYGGRWDIVEAARNLAERARSGDLDPVALDQETFSRCLATGSAPDPDLVVRTGGERRISNFLLWQLAYAELYFSDTLWPDFDAAALEAALRWYAGRQRRFGRTAEQIAAGSGHA